MNDLERINSNADRLNTEADETLAIQGDTVDPALEEAQRRREGKAELARQKAQEAFWAVRHQNPRRQRIMGIRRALSYVRTRYVRDGTVVRDGQLLPAVRVVTVDRRNELSGRQWRKLRKELNREAKRRAEQPPQELPT